MGSIRIFGTAVEWGLTRERHRELCAELSDHLESMAERETEGAAQSGAQIRAEAEAARLSSPAVRRRLASAHLTDQVVATLHRRPSREEWRELAWLGFWFVLIVASDLLAAHFNSLIIERESGITWSPALRYRGYAPNPAAEVWLSFAAWLLMGIARAGFFSSFAQSLYRAWQTGWGVCLGRVIQLKLIHTVLVVVALMGIGSVVDRFAWGGFSELYIDTELPYWLTAQAICLPLLLCGIAVWVFRRRAWAMALFLLISVFFLYPGGPASLRAHLLEQRIVGQIAVLSDGRRVTNLEAMRMDLNSLGLKVLRKDEPNAGEIHSRALKNAQWAQEAMASGSELKIVNVNEAANRITQRYYEPVEMWGHLSAWTTNAGRWVPKANDAWEHKRKWPIDPNAPRHLLAPNAVPGGGVGWLAAPIPFLTLIGLCGLVALLGRRSPAHLLTYLLLALLAMGTTLMPFFVGQPANNLMVRGPMAIMHTPFPGFEMLMATALSDLSYEGGMIWTCFSLIIGLLLSAAIPWLMTGLFLKPQAGAKLPEDPETA